MGVLEVKQVSKKYKDKVVLDDVNTTFETGINTLLGPNGAGKTTLMNIICGAIERSSGTILWDGANTDEMGDEYRGQLAMLFQHQPYFPGYRVDEFLFFSATLKGMKKESIPEEISRVLELVNLHDVKKSKIKTLSGGMRQRLFLAQTWMNHPKMIILDEPSVGLDIHEREELKKVLRKMSKDTIIIVSTHIVSDVEDITDKLFLLNHGQIVKQGTMEELNEEGQGIASCYHRYIEQAGEPR